MMLRFRVVENCRLGDVLGGNLTDLTVAKYDLRALSGIREGRTPLGVAARPLTKGEVITYDGEGNTDDILITWQAGRG
jgi:hypothetical protein